MRIHFHHQRHTSDHTRSGTYSNDYSTCHIKSQQLECVINFIIDQNCTSNGVHCQSINQNSCQITSSWARREIMSSSGVTIQTIGQYLAASNAQDSTIAKHEPRH